MIYLYQITASKRGYHMPKAAKGIPGADWLKSLPGCRSMETETRD